MLTFNRKPSQYYRKRTTLPRHSRFLSVLQYWCSFELHYLYKLSPEDIASDPLRTGNSNPGQNISNKRKWNFFLILLNAALYCNENSLELTFLLLNTMVVTLVVNPCCLTFLRLTISLCPKYSSHEFKITPTNRGKNTAGCKRVTASHFWFYQTFNCWQQSDTRKPNLWFRSKSLGERLKLKKKWNLNNQSQPQAAVVPHHWHLAHRDRLITTQLKTVFHKVRDLTPCGETLSVLLKCLCTALAAKASDCQVFWQTLRSSKFIRNALLSPDSSPNHWWDETK